MLKGRTHWADFLSADFNSRPTGVGRLQWFQNIKHIRPTMRESVVESADSAVQSADYWSRPTGNWPSGYGPLGSNQTTCIISSVPFKPVKH